MMDKPIVTGILSYGMSGKVFHAPFIDAHPSFNLYGITERSKKVAQERYPAVKSFDSVDEMIADPEIELIIVNTPNNTHYDYAKQALLAGKHILVDKPFAESAQRAKEIFDLGKKVGKYVMAYHNRRWDSDYSSVKQVIESGALGKLIEVHFRYDRFRKELSPKTFKETKIPASGIAYDLGSHLLDQAISIFGKPVKSTKVTSINRENSQVDDYAAFHLIYPDQLNVFITASLLVAKPLPSTVIHGTNGSYIKERSDVQEEQLIAGMSPLDPAYGIEDEKNKGIITLVDDNGVIHTNYQESLKGAYDGLFEAVYRQIRLNEAFPVKEEEVLWQMDILEQPEL